MSRRTHAPAAPVLRATQARPALMLAPMEGISDAIVRAQLSAMGYMDLCVTEFIRVVRRPVPVRVFKRECPELLSDGRTPWGTPVAVQLLGGEPRFVAESATIACELGALGIDLNFGCPAKKVNGSDGGAALLKTPHRLTEVVGATRNAVPQSIPVSAKIRLGWDDPDAVVDLVKAAEAGGADWITIHGRTKTQMYKPYADWTRIRRAVEAVRTPIVANGDIFCPESFARCKEVTGCTSFMLGRGAFRCPNLFRMLRGVDRAPMDLQRCADLLFDFAGRVLKDRRFKDPDRVALNRIKGWSRAMGEVHPDMLQAFHTLKRSQVLKDALEVLRTLPEAARSAA